MRVVRNTIIFLVLVAAAASAVLVFGIPAGFLASKIEERVKADTGYRMSIDGSIRIEFWPSPNLQIGKVALIDESDRGQRRLTVENVRIEAEASSLLSGRPRLTDIALVRPTFYVPLVRERVAPASAQPSDDGNVATAEPAPITIDRFVVTDGAIVLSDEKDAYENRLERVEITGTVTGPDDAVAIKATALAGEQILGLSVQGKVPGLRLAGRAIPVEFTLEAPGLLQEPVPGTAEIKTKGSLFSINSLSGKIGRNQFNGWTTVDFASKPLVKMDLDFQRLEIAVAPPTAPTAGKETNLDEPWSDTQFNLVGLNFFDAELQISSAELSYDKFRFAPIALAAILNNGVLTTAVTRTGAYGGQIQGTLAVDASAREPSHALRVDLTAVQALPFLTDVAGFPHLDARMVAKIDARGRGRSQRAIMASLDGAIDLQFQDGQIRDVNVAQMIRSLTASIMQGWDEKRAEKTDLSQLSAFFRIERGRATTDNFNLVGPLVRVTGAGTADIGAKTLEFRLNPQLVLSLEGQGANTANPVGFGVPVVVKGTWGAPRFYPEVSGILDNPSAAYDKLRELGAGLFGTDAGKPGAGNPIMQGVESLFGPKPGDKPPASQGQATPQGAPAQKPAPQSQSGAQPPKSDSDTQVRDMLRDLFGR